MKLQCFIQIQVESGKLSLEQIRKINHPQPDVALNAQQTVEAHQAIQDLFSALRQSAREAHSPHHPATPDDAPSHGKDSQARALEVRIASALERAVFEHFQAFFQSDRSSGELLLLSDCLLALAKSYIKNGK